MLISELEAMLAKKRLEHGDLLVKFAENEFMELRDIQLNVYETHAFDPSLGKLLEVDCI